MTVVVRSMDRLARNLDDLRRIVHPLTGKGVRIEFVKERLAFTGGFCQVSRQLGSGLVAGSAAGRLRIG